MHDNNIIPIKCLVIDDEPMARDIIIRYIRQVKSLELSAEFGNAIDASMYLQANKVDIIFLDIRMPQLNGTDFIKCLRTVPRIIFTTAYKEYALEGFELDVTDFLLKPIRFDRFLKAVNKAFPQPNQVADIVPQAPVRENKDAASFVYLRIDRKMIKLILDDILYIESDKDYVKIFTLHGTIMTRQTITSVEAMLSDSQFMRIHRSFIVSLNKIKSFTHEIVEIGKKELPIGKLYRNSFLKLNATRSVPK